ncbi:2'-5' RNA ligase family protein [Rufibacter soli]
MDLAAHYQSLWENAEQHFSAADYELDDQIDSPHDTRRGITLLARPKEPVRENIQNFLQDMSQLEPDLYYYPPTDFHITLLTIISCYPGFTLDQVQPQAYIDVVEQALRPIKKFKVVFMGVSASPSCVMVQGFPLGDELGKLREKVRMLFQSSVLLQSIDQRYTLQTAHSSLIRLPKPPAHPQAFLNKLREYRRQFFGSTEIRQVELVFNDWYQRRVNTQTLATFDLG